MDPATIASTIAAARQVYKYGSQIIEYIRDDQSAKLGLLAPVRIVVEGPGVGIGAYQTADHLFTMISPDLNRVEFTIQPFPADAKSPWNGPDAIRNDWRGGSLPASLVHDLITLHRDAIAYELDRKPREIWTWSSGILASVWDYYGGDNPKSRLESWLAYHLTKRLGRTYTWLKRHLTMLMLLTALAILPGCAGCTAPDWHVTEATPVISVEAGVPGVVTNTPPSP